VNGRRIRIPTNNARRRNQRQNTHDRARSQRCKGAGETISLWLRTPKEQASAQDRRRKLSYRTVVRQHHGNLIEQGYSVSPSGPPSGVIRGPELKAGVVPHALAATVKDTNRTQASPGWRR